MADLGSTTVQVNPYSLFRVKLQQRMRQLHKPALLQGEPLKIKASCQHWLQLTIRAKYGASDDRNPEKMNKDFSSLSCTSKGRAPYHAIFLLDTNQEWMRTSRIAGKP